MDLILQNIALGISLAAPIGPSSLTVIRNGVRRGFFAGFLAALGIVFADIVFLLLIYLGVSSFLSIPIVKTTTWIIGTFVLIYLGYKSITKPIKKVNLEDNKKAKGQPLLEGLFVTLSNPMSIIWWFGVFGSVLSSSTQNFSRLHALLISSTVLIGILFWQSGLALLTHWGKRFINEKNMKFVSTVAGLALIFFGLSFGYNVLTSLI